MARDILKILEAFPNEEYFSDGQGEALRWVADLGVNLPEDAATEPFIGISDNNKTHWIALRIVRRDPRPGADGIYVSCIPRSAISGEELKKAIFATYGGKVLRERNPR